MATASRWTAVMSHVELTMLSAECSTALEAVTIPAFMLLSHHFQNVRGSWTFVEWFKMEQSAEKEKSVMMENVSILTAPTGQQIALTNALDMGFVTTSYNVNARRVGHPRTVMTPQIKILSSLWWSSLLLFFLSLDLS